MLYPIAIQDFIILIFFLAHLAYFVPLLKLADFVKAGADVSFGLSILPKNSEYYG